MSNAPRADCDAMAAASTVESAREYVRRGWAVVPIPCGQKGPRDRNRPSAPSLGPAWARKWAHSANRRKSSGTLVCVESEAQKSELSEQR